MPSPACADCGADIDRRAVRCKRCAALARPTSITKANARTMHNAELDAVLALAIKLICIAATHGGIEPVIAELDRNTSKAARLIRQAMG